MPMRPPLLAAALAAIACRDGTTADAGALRVDPAAVTCVAGDRVELRATEAGRPTAATFTVEGDPAWLASVRRDRGAATLVCEAAGRGGIAVERGTTRVVVPVVVDPPPDGTLRVTLAPETLTLVNGTSAPVHALVSSARTGVSTDARFTTSDTAVATVDSLLGLVTATGPGTTTIVAAARADRRVRATARVTVTRASALAVALTTSPGSVAVLIGDSARVSATVQLADTAPPGTSRAVRYSSENTAVAEVSPSGVVRGIAAGGTTIVATAVVAPGLKSRIPVTVFVPAP
ncbi:Ig domain protein group 2 domain protein [Gemmatirosa kalamazoonensis]|uniref:Ig domain protein group 2 domain protein n=2 Tax=Gemmatirosa kalamazoonensis TaxID=861299 RepID=W0RI90_9BACT|nr:Ig domain protein group 2 domain protein [Gemmatirosa kalamazoonensis]